MLTPDSLVRSALAEEHFLYRANQSFELNTDHRQRVCQDKKGKHCPRVMASKYIKKPYILAKVGLAVKEELGK